MIISRSSPLCRNRNNKTPNSKTEEATLHLYDEIGFWGVDATEFVAAVNSIESDVIHLRVNSPGGDVFAARTMHTALKQHKAKIIAHVDGIAGSAASFLLMAADEIEMVDGGFIMIHKALSFFDILGYFNTSSLNTLSTDIQKEGELLSKIDGSIANDYAKRTGKSQADMLQKMEDETWFTAAEALEVGLIDRIYDGKPIENKYDLSFFAKTPDILKRQDDALTKRTAEKALRDAGFPVTAAKAILAGGWADESKRDVEIQQPEPQTDVTQRDVAAEVATEMTDSYSLLIKNVNLALIKEKQSYVN